jgi:UDP-N-acetylglucosamine 2-epimerase (non-hydrolysing)
MAHAENPFGDGRAAERVVAALRFHFGRAAEPPAPFAARLAERQLAGRAA